MRTAALIPVKRFDAAKGRLAAALDSCRRADLARWLATGVVTALQRGEGRADEHDIDVFVACDSTDVADWARELGATVIWGPGLGLNGAIDDGVTAISAAGYDHVIVAHADLARPAALPRVVRPGTATVVPDRRRDGTNVMSFPLTHPVRAAYGPSSFDRHLATASALGIPVEVRVDHDLSLDIDTPSDLHHPLIREALSPWLRMNPDNLR